MIYPLNLTRMPVGTTYLLYFTQDIFQIRYQLMWFISHKIAYFVPPGQGCPFIVYFSINILSLPVRRTKRASAGGRDKKE